MCDNEKGDTNKTLWDYFVKCDAENAKCLKCSAILKLSQRSRKGLVTHLRSKHCIDLKSQSQASTSRKDPCNVSAQPQIVDNCEIPKKRPKQLITFSSKKIPWKKLYLE